MGTDGLFDNLFDQDIEGCLHPSVKAHKDQKDQFELENPEGVAKCMANKAYKLGKDRRYDSPFSQGARQYGKRGYIGGKPDDITVIVSQIVRQ